MSENSCFVLYFACLFICFSVRLGLFITSALIGIQAGQAHSECGHTFFLKVSLDAKGHEFFQTLQPN